MDVKLRLLLLLSAAFTLHNADEWSGDLPGWVAMQAPRLAPGHAGFTPALAAVTLLPPLAIAALPRLAPRAERPALMLFAAVLGLNALWHLALSLATASVMPGLWSGIFLLLPAAALALRQLRPARPLALAGAAALAMAAGTAGALALGALLARV